MSYIGQTPTVGNFQVCDAISATATDTFNLLVGGVAISPQSAQHCLVSLNGILQAPISSYTISGSTIVFASAITTSDSIDFITVLGDVLDIGAPSDATVTNAKLAQDIISGETELAVAPASTDEFLISDAGVLKRVDASLVGRGKVGQIVSAIKTDTANTTSTTAVTTGLSVTITPTATSSKILLQANIGAAANSAANNRTYFAFNGGNTATYIGDAATGHETAVGFVTHRTSYDMFSASMTYLDSPATTSATTYSIYYWGNTGTTYFNSSPTLDTGNGNGASSITAIEVLA
jgi:hypothetical protein